jgi:hypothetical protein
MTNQENISDRDMKLAVILANEEAVWEFAGSSTSGNAHIDTRALAGLQGSGRYMHASFRLPLVLNTVIHSTSSEAPAETPPEASQTKRFIH